MADLEPKNVVEDALKTAGIAPQSSSKKDILGGPTFLVCNKILYDLKDACLDFAKKQAFTPKLNVFVCSPGGLPDVAFNSLNILRSRCKELVVFVPDYAKSAATLFCLGANEIVMGLGSQLGPLDMQVRDPRNSPEDISALSGYKALEAVANFLHTEIDVTVNQLFVKARANIIDSLSYAMKLVDSMARPLFEQVNPLDLGYFSKSLEVSEKYGVELMCRYHKISEDDSKKIVSRLVRNYPSHSFVIDLPEALKIGLTARAPSADELRIMDETYTKLLENPALQKHGIFEW